MNVFVLHESNNLYGVFTDLEKANSRIWDISRKALLASLDDGERVRSFRIVMDRFNDDQMIVFAVCEIRHAMGEAWTEYHKRVCIISQYEVTE